MWWQQSSAAASPGSAPLQKLLLQAPERYTWNTRLLRERMHYLILNPVWGVGRYLADFQLHKRMTQCLWTANAGRKSTLQAAASPRDVTRLHKASCLHVQLPGLASLPYSFPSLKLFREDIRGGGDFGLQNSKQSWHKAPPFSTRQMSCVTAAFQHR